MRGGGASATIEACVNHAKEIAMSKKDENLTAEYENGKGDDREGGFIKSSPEANAGPAGAAQTSQGSAQGNQPRPWRHQRFGIGQRRRRFGGRGSGVQSAPSFSQPRCTTMCRGRGTARRAAPAARACTKSSIEAGTLTRSASAWMSSTGWSFMCTSGTNWPANIIQCAGTLTGPAA
jgi:hypothetical protein